MEPGHIQDVGAMALVLAKISAAAVASIQPAPLANGRTVHLPTSSNEAY